VLERKAPPTFDVMVEIRDRDRVAVHLSVADTVDAILRGQAYNTQIRYRSANGMIEMYEEETDPEAVAMDASNAPSPFRYEHGFLRVWAFHQRSRQKPQPGLR
jgi:hypothetical protein